MEPKLGYDKPHSGVPNGRKRGNSSAKRYNLTYDEEQHPFGSPEKAKGLINQCV